MLMIFLTLLCRNTSSFSRMLCFCSSNRVVFYVQTYTHYVIDIAVEPSVTRGGDGYVGWKDGYERNIFWLEDRDGEGYWV